MSVWEYIKDKWVAICIGLLVCMLSAMFMLVMEVAMPVAVAVEVIFFAGFASMIGYDCFRKKTYYDELERTWEGLDEKTYLSEIIEEPGFYDGKVLYRLVKDNGKYLNDVIADQQREMMDYKEYVQTWVHEIKTPIAVERLLIENNRNPLTSSLEEEVGRIEGYVEQLLFYTKSGSLESDYLIQPVNLKSLVMEVIRRHSKMMVGAGVFPKMDNLDYEVLTDPKWMEFILGQILTNSVKYRDKKKRPFLFFTAEEEDGDMLRLTVADNGIGIPASDIPRVFTKGFTGENGRNLKRSTGMGLYLCRELCDKMEIPLDLQSRAGEGTELVLRLKRNRS
ncbi:sensor histidine kinase [Anaerovorax odorimutans]|uniref:histidine kinase n=1 Tax=Anaerovorax odorimutans TaxID=109327 RepID=A0ABT1RPH3_9FIRM|nr:sensor histidine kinase [Anaerovorax odorimutans]MCQ4637094.1 sensor histidine kinase [Anaerovorax odorimutans]